MASSWSSGQAFSHKETSKLVQMSELTPVCQWLSATSPSPPLPGRSKRSSDVNLHGIGAFSRRRGNTGRAAITEKEVRNRGSRRLQEYRVCMRGASRALLSGLAGVPRAPRAPRVRAPEIWRGPASHQQGLGGPKTCTAVKAASWAVANTITLTQIPAQEFLPRSYPRLPANDSATNAPVS